MVSCILLSAGLSSRFGSPKALALINHVTVIERTQKALIDSSVDEIIIVLGSESKRIKPYILKHKKVKVVYNKDYNLGQTSSFKIGLNFVNSDAKGVMLFPVDFPLVKSETLDSLINKFYLQNPGILIPSYRDRKGHPPIFNAKFKNEFLSLSDDQGLNLIQHQYSKDVFLFEVIDSGVIRTFNTLEELDKINHVAI